jgi:amino acid permease
MKAALLAASAVVLFACLAIPPLFFAGRIDELSYKNWLAVASLAWFCFATMYATRRRS